MNNLSIGANVNSALNNTSSSDLGKNAQISQIKSRISSAEQRLAEINQSDRSSSEKSQLSSQINAYKSQLAKLNGSSTNSGSQNEQLSDADMKRRFDSYECQTCKERRYQDDSDDSGVSFQTPTNVAPSAADSAVRSHENEHVSRNRTKAQQNGMKIVSQSVTIQRAICPECGKTYTSGGVTRTTMKTDTSEKYSVGMFDAEQTRGKGLNTVA